MVVGSKSGAVDITAVSMPSISSERSATFCCRALRGNPDSSMRTRPGNVDPAISGLTLYRVTDRVIDDGEFIALK